MHGNAAGLHARLGPALVGLHAVLQTQHVVLHLVQTHDVFQLPVHLVQHAGVLLPQQAQQVHRLAAGHRDQRPALRCTEDGCRTRRRFLLQLILRQRLKAPVIKFPDGCRAPAGTCLPPGQRLEALVRRDGQLQLPGRVFGQLLQTPPGNGLQLLLGEGPGGAHVAQGVHHARAHPVRQLFRPLFAQKYQVFAPGRQFAHRVRHQGSAHVHQHPLLHRVAAVQRSLSGLGQRRQRVQKARVAPLVMAEYQHLPRPVQGAVQVLQKQLLLPGARVKPQVHPGDLRPAQQLAGRHFPGNGFQGLALAGARRAVDQKYTSGGFSCRAQHEGPFEGPHQPFEKFRLAQHGFSQRLLQPVKGVRLHGGGHRAPGRLGLGLGEQAVPLHGVFQFAAKPGDLLRLAGQRFAQRLLILLQSLLCILCGLLALGRLCPARPQPPTGAEHSVHQVFPIACSHGSRPPFAVWQSSALIVPQTAAVLRQKNKASGQWPEALKNHTLPNSLSSRPSLCC